MQCEPRFFVTGSAGKSRWSARRSILTVAWLLVAMGQTIALAADPTQDRDPQAGSDQRLGGATRSWLARGTGGQGNAAAVDPEAAGLRAVGNQPVGDQDATPDRRSQLHARLGYSFRVALVRHCSRSDYRFHSLGRRGPQRAHGKRHWVGRICRGRGRERTPPDGDHARGVRPSVRTWRPMESRNWISSLRTRAMARHATMRTGPRRPITTKSGKKVVRSTNCP